MTFVAFLVSPPVFAIPAWSRKYDLPCSACHYPAPPRLNIEGHRFRRAQYRMEDEFGKEVDWKKVGNYAAVRVRARYEYVDPETGTVTSSFKLNDATFFYAGPISKHFSGFVELERPGDDPEIEAVVQVGGVAGTPDAFWTFRTGQFHTLSRVGFGGFDRPTGLSTPDAISQALVANDPFRLNQDQVGVEGTYVWNRHRFIAQILNGGDLGTGATTDRADQNRAKDFVVAYEYMWGDTASGLTALYYDGTQDDLTSAAAPDEVSLKRYGVSAAHVFKQGFEVQGGYLKGTDDYSAPVLGVDSIDGEGYWLELEQYFSKAKDLTVLARYDFTDPDTDTDDNEREQFVVGFVLPVAGWHVRWGVELRRISLDTPAGTLDDDQAVGEIMLNF